MVSVARLFNAKSTVETEAPILWPPNAKSQLIGKDPDSGKYLKQKEKWVAEVEIVRQHHQLNGHKFKQISEDNRGQRSLACYTARGHEELAEQQLQCSLAGAQEGEMMI